MFEKFIILFILFEQHIFLFCIKKDIKKYQHNKEQLLIKEVNPIHDGKNNKE